VSTTPCSRSDDGDLLGRFKDVLDDLQRVLESGKPLFGLCDLLDSAYGSSAF